MAKGGNDQSSNGSRFRKPHKTSNSFVTKVASRVSDYLGGWFGTPLKSSQNAEAGETPRSSGDTTDKHLLNDIEPRRWTVLSQGVFNDDIEAMSSPAKRFKISDKEKLDIDFPISPIPSTSGLYQNTISHTFEMPKRENFEMTVAGPSTLQGQKFTRGNDVAPTPSSERTDVKANGATDNHSDSSESTSGCSSLVPQSDRLSQSACSNRKRNLEEKLKYARQLQQSRASMYLNRSIPVGEAPGGRKKPSFDVTVYGSPALDRSLLRDKLISSPFYTGQTSYGGASAYRPSRNTFYSHRNPRASPERREGIKVQVKPSHHGSTEDLTNMSHTAKKILEALEQFSTPVNDAKRIPLSRNAPLSTKRRRFDELSETRLRLSTPVSPLNPNPGPVITGLNVPTVPDLLKLKRLERIQNSTAAARQVAVQKQEYALPSEPEKHTGKIVTKLKKKEKDVPMEKLEEVNLPKISLPITTLPKFDFELPALPKPAEKPVKTNKYVFSPPIPVSVKELPDVSAQTNNFKFSEPINPLKTKSVAPLTNFMSSDAVAKLKRKSIKGETANKTSIPPTPTELRTGSVMDFFKSVEKKDTPVKPVTGTWECSNCLLRNLNDCQVCVGCKGKKAADDRTETETKNDSPVADAKPSSVQGFGDKFKPPPGTWSCKECFIRNSATDGKCIACEAPNPTATPSKKEQETPKVIGFGDKFKKQANEWECPDCMIRNKDSVTKCVACEAAKPGAKPENSEPKLKCGIDKSESEGVKSPADSSTKTQSNGPQPGFLGISTSVGVFTFGLPSKNEESKTKSESARPAENSSSSSSFQVTSTSGISKKVDSEKRETKDETVKPFIFGVQKSPKLIFGYSAEEKPKGEGPKFVLGPNSTSGSLETVSSSTSDFSFGLAKSVDSAKPNFQFKALTPPEAGSSPPGEVAKAESTVASTSAPVSVTPSFGTSSTFNSSKMTFGTTSTSSSFGTGSQAIEPSACEAPPSSFSTSGFPSQSAPAPGFGAIPQTDKPAENTFGANSFSGAPFASAQNPEPAKTFSFGSSTPFGTNTTPASSLCSGFIQPVAAEKPAPFIFGAPTPAMTTSASGFAGPGFGTSKPDSKPSFNFGQVAGPGFGFGSNSPGANFFGSFRQSKPENSIGGSGLPFGGTGTGVFGQSSAPAAFESTTPKFVFGSSGNQQPEAAPVFKFGAPAAQSPSAPADTGIYVPEKLNFSGGQTDRQCSAPAAFESTTPKFVFGNSGNQQQEAPPVFKFGAAATPETGIFVPEKLNFSGGQTLVFSGTPGADESSEIRKTRKVIKAVRRTARDPMRRPQ